MGFYLLGNPIYVQGKNIEILANMKADRAYYRRNIGSLNKGAGIELLKVIVSHVLDTGSNRICIDEK